MQDVKRETMHGLSGRLRPFVLLAGVAALGACQTASQVPNKRPLTPEARMALAETDVVMTGMHRGVGMGWNSAGAQQNPGIMTMLFNANPAVAMLGQVAVTAAMDAGPSGRAKRNVNELNDAFQNYDLSKSMRGHLRRELNEVDGLKLGEVTTSSTPSMVMALPDAMAMRTSYVLSEDGSAVKVTLDVRINADDIPYETPYAFDDYVPRAQRSGPIYYNRFVYVTDRLDMPRLSYTFREQLIADIEAAYAGKEDDPKAMRRKAKELEKARDDELSTAESASYLVRKWSENDAERLLAELDKAHAWLAARVKEDLNSDAVPVFSGGRHKTRVAGSGRVDTIVGFGPSAGAYISEPAQDVSELPLTFGNALKIAEENRGFDGGF